MSAVSVKEAVGPVIYVVSDVAVFLSDGSVKAAARASDPGSRRIDPGIFPWPRQAAMGKLLYRRIQRDVPDLIDRRSRLSTELEFTENIASNDAGVDHR